MSISSIAIIFQPHSGQYPEILSVNLIMELYKKAESSSYAYLVLLGLTCGKVMKKLLTGYEFTSCIVLYTNNLSLCLLTKIKLFNYT